MNIDCTYLLCERIKGKKWRAIAGTNSGGCLAAACDVFELHGLDTTVARTRFASSITKQKNFAGYSDVFVVVDMSDRDRWIANAIKHANRFGKESAKTIWYEVADEIDKLELENCK